MLKYFKPNANSVARWMTKRMLFYPQLTVHATGAFVPHSSARIDPQLVSRIKTAYRLAIDSFEGAGNSPWSNYGTFSADIHRALLAESDAEIARVLEDPFATKLFYGFYSIAQDLHLDEASREGRRMADWAVHQIFGCLVRLAEATGSCRLWNPEGNEPAPTCGTTPADLERLLEALDGVIGARLDFPNPFPREFGLASSRGIASYRVPQAIYQAWRIRELLREAGKMKVLEIGAGMGRTAYYARRFGIVGYAIVDLPLANVAQAAFLGSVLGSDAIWLPGDPASQRAGRIQIYPPNWLGSCSEKFDLALNADSMPEMDEQHAIEYFRQISRVAGLFVSINHENYALRVRDLPAKCAIKAQVIRYPYWLRKGYVEEIFAF